MEIQTLKALMTAQDLNDIAKRYAPDDMPVKDLTISITDAGLSMTGVYPMFVKVKFELTWEVGVREGSATARLTACKAFGVPATMVKGMVMKAVTSAVKKEEAVRVDDDMILVDVDLLLARNGLETKTNLTAIACRADGVWIEAEKA